MTRNLHLPVLRDQLDPLDRPVTVGDCRGGVRPCPWVSCRFNLLIDVLDDGSIVINAPSKRLAGADRTIADKHEFDHDAVWFVEVRLPDRAQLSGESVPQIFALGPMGSARRAREIAKAWEAEIAAEISSEIEARVARAKKRVTKIMAQAHVKARAITSKVKDGDEALVSAAKVRAGARVAKARARAARIMAEAREKPEITKIHRKLPDHLRLVGGVREGALDSKFLDEAEDAIDYWFDDEERSASIRSCLLDEVAKSRAAARAVIDEERLLEEISGVLFVSRERVRQIESMAFEHLAGELAKHGLSVADLLEYD